MHSWPTPTLPDVPGTPVPLRLYDTADRTIRTVTAPQTAGMYVCGITPYDATHLGHAATYLTFDLIYRVLRDNNHQVHFVQNVTDVDDPLFERAERDGVDWRELGTSQINLFRSDMEALEVFPPQDFISVSESVDEVIELVSTLLDKSAAYIVDDPEHPDIYASIKATEQFGYESGYDRDTMMAFFAERGGDPERPGKRDPLDALVWRAARDGEPSWDAPFGAGRPGWHVECSAIAGNRLGENFAIQGGGTDLIFPHHEFSAAHYEAARAVPRMAGHYVHAGMIALDGVKMSKSLGNLVFVSKLLAAGHHPSAIRLGVYASHYRTDRDWSDHILATAEKRRAAWSAAAHRADDPQAAHKIVQELRQALADDLDTPAALAAVDRWAGGYADPAAAPDPSATTHSPAGAIVADAVHALLGVRI